MHVGDMIVASMENYIAQGVVLVLMLLVAGVKSLSLEPADLPVETSQKQLQALLKLHQVLQSNLLLLNIVILTLLAIGQYDIFQILAFAFIWLVVVHLLAAGTSVKKHARRFALRHQELLIKLALALEPALSLLDNTRFIFLRKSTKSFASKAELLRAIKNSKGILTKTERQKLEKLLDDTGAVAKARDTPTP